MIFNNVLNVKVSKPGLLKPELGLVVLASMPVEVKENWGVVGGELGKVSYRGL